MNDIKCLIGMHHYENSKEETITDARGNVIGKAMIGVCKNCGKIKVTRIATVE